MIAARQALTAFRKDPLHLVMAVEGADLTGAAMKFCVRQKPDATGDPLLLLTSPAAAGAKGIRLVEVTVDEDGVATSVIEILALKADMGTMPAAAEPGADLTLSYDFEWTPAAVAGGLTEVEETVMFGDFIVLGSCND